MPVRSLRLHVLGPVVSALLILTACAGGGGDDSATAAGPGADGFPLEVEHEMGTTTIENKPKRVVALDPSYIDATLELDAELVGYVQYRADPENPFPAYLGADAAAAEKAVNVGTMAEPDLEKILELEPDLIISARVRHEAIYDQLSKIAPTVFSETTGPTWKDNVVLLGEALGEKQQAEDAVKAYEERARAVGERIVAKEPDATYSLVRFSGEDTARLYSTTSFIGEIMADMGVPRTGAPDSDQEIFVPLSAEQILQADAGLIMVSTWSPPGDEGKASRAQQAQFEANPLWGRLKGQKLTVDDETFVASVSLQGAHAVIDELAEQYDVDPQAQ